MIGFIISYYIAWLITTFFMSINDSKKIRKERFIFTFIIVTILLLIILPFTKL